MKIKAIKQTKNVELPCVPLEINQTKRQNIRNHCMYHVRLILSRYMYNLMSIIIF